MNSIATTINVQWTRLLYIFLLMCWFLTLPSLPSNTSHPLAHWNRSQLISSLFRSSSDHMVCHRHRFSSLITFLQPIVMTLLMIIGSRFINTLVSVYSSHNLATCYSVIWSKTGDGSRLIASFDWLRR